jgi:hypothetical protein
LAASDEAAVDAAVVQPKARTLRRWLCRFTWLRLIRRMLLQRRRADAVVDAEPVQAVVVVADAVARLPMGLVHG